MRTKISACGWGFAFVAATAFAQPTLAQTFPAPLPAATADRGSVVLTQAAQPGAPAQPAFRRARQQQAQPNQLRTRMKEQLNEWTLGLAAGRIEGAPLRLAAELAAVMDDGDNFRILPIVTRGIFDNFNDLLYLRGVDLAIVYGDTLIHFKEKEKVPNVEQRVGYLANLFPAEMHVLVGPDIATLKQLEGKKVNFNTPGTAAAYTGPIVFDRLGIKLQATFQPHREVMAKMKNGDKEFAAVVFVSSKPIEPIAANWPQGFKLLPVPYTKELEEYYLPATLTGADYPKLIGKDDSVSTIAVPTVLAVYNWRSDTDRYRRLDRMIDRMFERWTQLHKQPYDPKWKEVNLASTVPGWKRYEPMQKKLDGLMPKAAPKAPVAATASAKVVDANVIREQAQKAAPNDKAEQERLFQQFMEWNKKRSAQ